MKFKYSELINTLKYIEEISKKFGSEIKFCPDNIEDMGCPHVFPKKLPNGMGAVYIFIYKKTNECLKIGKANENSNDRFIYQHYKICEDRSSVAKSLCNDQEFEALGLNSNNVDEWMKANLQRINIYYPADRAVTELVEAILHYKFRPRFEGNLYSNKKQ